METTNTEKTFRIPDANLFRLQEQLAKLSKKAVKLCGQPITLTVIKTEEVPRKDPRGQETGIIDIFHQVSVSGPTPVIPGYKLVAALDVMEAEDGEKVVLVRNAPGETAPEEARTRIENCDHCNVKRNRKSLYVLRKV